MAPSSHGGRYTCDPRDRQTDRQTEPAAPAKASRLVGLVCLDDTGVQRLPPDFLGLEGGGESHTGLASPGLPGEGEAPGSSVAGTHSGPPRRLGFGSGLPRPHETQELINALEENIGGVL